MLINVIVPVKREVTNNLSSCQLLCLYKYENFNTILIQCFTQSESLPNKNLLDYQQNIFVHIADNFAGSTRLLGTSLRYGEYIRISKPTVSIVIQTHSHCGVTETERGLVLCNYRNCLMDDHEMLFYSKKMRTVTQLSLTFTVPTVKIPYCL